jgi:hypothetical protein
MKANVLVLCLAIAPLMVSCRFSYLHHSYKSSSSTTTNKVNNEEYSKTIKKVNGFEECSYSYKNGGYSYALKSNGPLKINDGVVEKLGKGQKIDLVVVEDGQTNCYMMCREVGMMKVGPRGGAMTEEDETRAKKALVGVEKQAK